MATSKFVCVAFLVVVQMCLVKAGFFAAPDLSMWPGIPSPFPNLMPPSPFPNMMPLPLQSMFTSLLQSPFQPGFPNALQPPFTSPIPWMPGFGMPPPLPLPPQLPLF